MGDWKMPEELKEIFQHINIHLLEVGVRWGSKTAEQVVRVAELLRSERLLSTPTERDAREKRRAELEAALDGANHQNTAAWVKVEKLKAEVEKLNSELELCEESEARL